MIKKSIGSIVATLLLSGCAEIFLEQRIQEVEGNNRQLDDYSDMSNLSCHHDAHGQYRCSLRGAIELAYNQADAYARAARQSQITQDTTFGILLAAAGWTALGAIDSVSDDVLARGAVTAVAAQQVGQRSVPQNAIQSLYAGATRMNCIAAAGSIYEEVDLGDLSAGGTTGGDIPVRFASFIMVLAMREVEYRTLHGTSRSLEDFSSLLGAFSRIITETSELTTITETEEPDIRFDTEDTSGRQVQTSRTTVIRQNPALERFFGVVSGCLDSNVVSPDTSAREPT